MPLSINLRTQLQIENWDRLLILGCYNSTILYSLFYSNKDCKAEMDSLKDIFAVRWSTPAKYAQHGRLLLYINLPTSFSWVTPCLRINSSPCPRDMAHNTFPMHRTLFSTTQESPMSAEMHTLTARSVRVMISLIPLYMILAQGSNLRPYEQV